MKDLIKNKWVWAAVAAIIVVGYLSGIFSPAEVPVVE